MWEMTTVVGVTALTFPNTSWAASVLAAAVAGQAATTTAPTASVLRAACTARTESLGAISRPLPIRTEPAQDRRGRSSRYPCSPGFAPGWHPRLLIQLGPSARPGAASVDDRDHGTDGGI